MNRKGKIIAVMLSAMLLTAGCGKESGESKSSGNAGTSVSSIPGSTQADGFFGCELIDLSGKNSAQVTAVYLEKLAEREETGLTPVMIFDEGLLRKNIGENRTGFQNAEEYAQSILANDHTNGEQRIQELYKEVEEHYGSEFLTINDNLLEQFLSDDDDSEESSDTSESTDSSETSQADEPAVTPGDSSSETDDTPAPHFMPTSSSLDAAAYMALVPTDKPYEVFAWLPFCGWGISPSVDDAVTVTKYWYDKYGAMPAVITHNTLSLYIPKPVDDLEQLKEITLEQCGFCSDIVGLLGVESQIYHNYASALWVFRWEHPDDIT